MQNSQIQQETVAKNIAGARWITYMWSVLWYEVKQEPTRCGVHVDFTSIFKLSSYVPGEGWFSQPKYSTVLQSTFTSR